jgi:hypothetical protein
LLVVASLTLGKQTVSKMTGKVSNLSLVIYVQNEKLLKCLEYNLVTLYCNDNFKLIWSIPDLFPVFSVKKEKTAVRYERYLEKARKKNANARN